MASFPVSETTRAWPEGLTRWIAPAKLNLFLHITGRRQDGYHNLQTLFQLLDYGDALGFEVADSGAITRRTEVAGVPPERDLTVRAATLLREASGVRLGVAIYVEKRLPMGGGLGGGSSDAATTLLVLNQLWGCGLSVDELAALAIKLGADVPVFVRGRTAWGEGIGERLTPVAMPACWYLVIKPPVEVPTAPLFAEQELTRNCPPITIPAFLAKGGANVFEPLVRRKYAEVDQAMRWLGAFGQPRLTGSGSCVFARFDVEERALDVIRHLPRQYQGFVARGVNESPLFAQLELMRS